jgi:TolB protein
MVPFHESRNNPDSSEVNDMKLYTGVRPLLLSISLLAAPALLLAQEQASGIFEGHGDIGHVLNKGAVSVDSGPGRYTVSGSGENMWFGTDAFHYVWKRASHDVSISAAVRFVGTGGNAHRKAGLVIRQSLEPDAPYADAVVHGDGLTSLQYREVKGGPTREIQSATKAPRRLRIQKEGSYVFMSLADDGGDFRSAGGSFKIRFEDPFFVGIGVCSHDSTVMEQAVFSDVQISGDIKPWSGESSLESTLETISIESKDRKAVYIAPKYIEGAFWSGEGDHLFFSDGGLLYKLPRTGGTPGVEETGGLKTLGSSNGFSHDGKLLAVSNYVGEHQSLIYIVPAGGGGPRLLVSSPSSWWHSWSPDGTSILFSGMRKNNLDVYSIPVRGGNERRLTREPGIDDGPEFSPDGAHVYFNSDRTGTSQIWRMNPDGSSPEQITSDGFNNWFPHVSPDGKWIVFLSYDKDVRGHPANRDIMLRIVPAAGGAIDVLAKLFGGQGTFDVNSWAPDSKNLAFISYRLVHK